MKSMFKLTSEWFWGALIFFLDRWLKSWFLAHPDKVLDLGMVKFSVSTNRGIAFGLFSSFSKEVISITSLAVMLIFALVWVRTKDRWIKVGTVLVLLGALSNFIDRLFWACVVDYIHLRWFPPVFNLADALITLGALVLIVREVSCTRGEGK